MVWGSASKRQWTGRDLTRPGKRPGTASIKKSAERSEKERAGSIALWLFGGAGE